MVEYKIHTIVTSGENEALGSISDLIDDGWEVVSLSTVDYNYPVLKWVFFLKR